MGSAKYVSKFDLLKGYWQVPLSERVREIAAFITPNSLYEYTAMPFGLRNAPATFQHLMNMVVGDLEGCSVYLDDVVIYSDSWDDHLDRIEKLFNRLARAQLMINLAKCEFAKATVTYLGRVVGQGTVSLVHAKVQAIDDYAPPPTDVFSGAGWLLPVFLQEFFYCCCTPDKSVEGQNKVCLVSRVSDSVSKC